MSNPEEVFDELWETFHARYPFFKLRGVDWQQQHAKYRPMVTSETSDDQLFDILCQMLDPLDDGHVELKAKLGKKGKRTFTAEKKPRFYREFTDPQIKALFADDREDAPRQWLREP